jgi:pimeloyl-ACP methyl ester carboxylesterase
MLPDLSRDHTVIAWDAPGFGDSSDIDDGWRAAQFADALAAFVAAVGVERPHLVGHSFGTMVALSLFRHHPAVPASLVLIGGYAGWAGSLPPEEVARRLEMFLGMAELGSQHGRRVTADHALPYLRQSQARAHHRPTSGRAGSHRCKGHRTDRRLGVRS